MLRPRFPSAPACGESASCRIEQGLGVYHGAEADNYFHPRLLAEEICADALIKRIRERNSNSQLQAAWSGLELALALQNCPDDAESFFNYAEEKFESMFHRSEKDFYKINAHIGLIYMPAFRARYAGERLSGRELQTVHARLADMLATFDATYDPRGRDLFPGVKPELVTHNLFARLKNFDWLSFPASPREENTDLKKFNHDSYVLRSDIKVPVQVKRDHGPTYDDSVAVVRLSRIIGRVNEERRRWTMQAWGSKRKATRPLTPLNANDFAQLIVREAQGEWLSEHEAWLLELGSMASVREVMEKEAVIRSQRLQTVRTQGRIAIAA